jgi:hypothetical protein
MFSTSLDLLRRTRLLEEGAGPAFRLRPFEWESVFGSESDSESSVFILGDFADFKWKPRLDFRATFFDFFAGVAADEADVNGASPLCMRLLCDFDVVRASKCAGHGTFRKGSVIHVVSKAKSSI